MRANHFKECSATDPMSSKIGTNSEVRVASPATQPLRLTSSPPASKITVLPRYETKAWIIAQECETRDAQRNFVCPVCEKSVNAHRVLLEVHLREHFQEYIHSCNRCGQPFISMCELVDHMRLCLSPQKADTIEESTSEVSENVGVETYVTLENENPDVNSNSGASANDIAIEIENENLDLIRSPYKFRKRPIVTPATPSPPVLRPVVSMVSESFHGDFDDDEPPILERYSETMRRDITFRCRSCRRGFFSEANWRRHSKSCGKDDCYADPNKSKAIKIEKVRTKKTEQAERLEAMKYPWLDEFFNGPFCYECEECDCKFTRWCIAEEHKQWHTMWDSKQ